MIDLRDRCSTSLCDLDTLRMMEAALTTSTREEVALVSELRRFHSASECALLAEAVDVEQKKKQMPYFTVKRLEYNTSITELERRLTASGFEEALTHESLVALAEEVTQLHAQIDPIDEKLRTFAALPPDMTLARVRVAEARQQLANLEEEFSNHISGMQQD
jgi:hypothetical protein